ncbi:MAG TPA: DEAD/DEAH box helicase [Acidimicrobiia bacterium]|nr:DEAD/DEAH box helicase [Acidimicrobiia bacterium]
MTGTPTPTPIAPWQFDMFVDAEIDGEATPEQLAALRADPVAWQASLLAQLRDVEDHLASARSLRGEERDLVVADLESEHRRLADAWARITGLHRDDPSGRSSGSRDNRSNRQERDDVDTPDLEPGVVELQVSWEPGKVVAWAAGRNAPAADGDELVQMLADAGAPASGWLRHGPVPLPNNTRADAQAIPVGDVLGWLVAAGAGQVEGVGASVRWLGRVAIWAVELTARGAMVPFLRQRTRRGGSARDSNGSYSVRWTPALVDPARLARLIETMPGSLLALDQEVDARALTRSALTGMVDAICRDGARQLDMPAPPPTVRTATDVAEAFLGRLDGTAFDAPTRLAGDVATRMERWGRSVTGERGRLIVRLDPPDDVNAWHLAVFATGPRSEILPIEQAIVNAGAGRPHIEDEMTRLERMLPALLRPGGTRRGEVVLSQDEAWDLMATTGPQLEDAGFDVRVPALSRRKPTPSLRVFVDASSESVVGANQLANVRWSAVFDDVELSAADIARLAREARPLIRSGGRWVAIDKADLQAAADALAERADTTQLTGAETLRLALGIEGSPLAGGVSVVGGGWAAELLEAAAEVSAAPAGAPAGFVGELRSYQNEALAWLGFLGKAGLGGCLALDMGLGKTPTMLADLLATAGSGPALVVAPPAVVGNWTAEAARFTPGLRVVVHHGANRAAADEIAAEVADADVVVTTYGTAVRDIDAISAVSWSKLVLDEAQAIKNPANDTSQQLRRIRANTRVALTGTPIENGLGDLWAILDFANPGLVGPRPQFIARLSSDGRAARVEAEDAMRALNGILVFRRTKAEPAIAEELPDQIDELDRCAMTPEQIGLYQALLDTLVTGAAQPDGSKARNGQILAAITALKQICNHPAAYEDDDLPLSGRSGKLARLEEIVDAVFAADESVLVFTHFAQWGLKLADHLTKRTGTPVACYHGGLTRSARDQIIADFQQADGPRALVLSLKAGGTGLNLTAASHVVLYDRWWNPAVEDQARDRAWRIGQTRTVICHRLICPGTVDERVEEVVAGKRRIADLVLPKSSSLADLDGDQLRLALGIRPDALLTDDLLASEEEQQEVSA